LQDAKRYSRWRQSGVAAGDRPGQGEAPISSGLDKHRARCAGADHVDGDPTPSRADLEMTKQVVQALVAVGITVHDHVIVGKNRPPASRASG